MQGDKIGEISGKVTSRRVLANPGGGPKVETSLEGSGRLFGVEAIEIITFWSVMRPDCSLYGEGHGITIGKGGEQATWVGQGVGTVKKDGGGSYRGALYYQTSVPAWSRLNTVAAIFEYDVDAQGSFRSQFWEWK